MVQEVCSTGQGLHHGRVTLVESDFGFQIAIFFLLEKVCQVLEFSTF